jgi:hypothetical protein
MLERDFNAKEDGTELGVPQPAVELTEEVMPLVNTMTQALAPVDKGSSGGGNDKDKGKSKGRESKIPLILEKINDPNFPLAECNRLIAIEILYVTEEMRYLRERVNDGDHTETFLQKSYVESIKALAQLEKSLTNTDILAHRDILNMDGPKFAWLFGEIVNSMKKACEDALGRDGETIVQSIMKHWRDELAMREARWRTEIEKIK